MNVASMEQASAFEFIDQSAINFGKTYVTREQRRRARVAVMKDYRSKLHKPDMRPRGTTLGGGVRTHTIKFRIPSYRRKQNRQSSAIDSEELDATEVTPKHGVAAIPRLLDAITWCIDDPDAQTRALCHYYLQSYWTNSAAVNPNGEWSIFFIVDPAMIHVKLSLVAMHLADRTTGEITSAQIYHRGQALRIIERRLAQHPGAITESTIGAIALLASLDNHSEWSVETRDTHMKALSILIEARGGIDSPQLSDALRRVVGWVDLLNCAINESKPFLRRSALAVTASQEELQAKAGVRLQALPSNSRRQPQPLKSLFKSLQQLSLLIGIKSSLSTFPSRKLRVQFSNSLWSLEYEILLLGNMGRGPTPWNQQSALRAFRDAIRICSYSNLRMQNSIFIYRKLMQRVQMAIAPLLNIAKAGDKAMLLDEVMLLLWVLFMGWKSAFLAHEDGHWFCLSAVDIVIRYKLQEYILQGAIAGDKDRYLWLGVDYSEMEQLKREMRNALAMATAVSTKSW